MCRPLTNIWYQHIDLIAYFFKLGFRIRLTSDRRSLFPGERSQKKTVCCHVTLRHSATNVYKVDMRTLSPSTTTLLIIALPKPQENHYRRIRLSPCCQTTWIQVKRREKGGLYRKSGRLRGSNSKYNDDWRKPGRREPTVFCKRLFAAYPSAIGLSNWFSGFFTFLRGPMKDNTDFCVY